VHRAAKTRTKTKITLVREAGCWVRRGDRALSMWRWYPTIRRSATGIDPRRTVVEVVAAEETACCWLAGHTTRGRPGVMASEDGTIIRPIPTSLKKKKIFPYTKTKQTTIKIVKMKTNVYDLLSFSHVYINDLLCVSLAVLISVCITTAALKL